MPLSSTYGIGAGLFAAGVSTKAGRYSGPLFNFHADPTFVLAIVGLPHVFWWFHQTAGNPGCTVTIEGALRASATKAAENDFIPLPIGAGPTIVLPVGVPVRIDGFFPGVQIRATFNRPAGDPTVVVDYILGCSAS